ncbi:uncharacterized protein METZ01_LOCUS121214 [marine metagenome]|uniref:Uncharacterized protein n=1 Tax=marine metagenome TaxID=408172 RepID=A0A381XUQ2_9ZZZZ
MQKEHLKMYDTNIAILSILNKKNKQ